MLMMLCSQHNKQFGVGVVVRDGNGLVVGALIKKLHLPLGPLEAKRPMRWAFFLQET